MDPLSFPDIMVDVETTGLDPGHAAMIQLSAVRFNLKERTVDAGSMFDRCLAVPPGRFWDEGTREWWGQQKPHILNDIMFRAEDPRTVMQAFSDWIGRDVPDIRFWAKPTTFDYAFVQSYFNQFGVLNPFNFRFATDVNSFIRGMAFDSSVATYKIDFQGDAHNALFDVLHQIQMVFEAEDFYHEAARSRGTFHSYVPDGRSEPREGLSVS